MQFYQSSPVLPNSEKFMLKKLENSQKKKFFKKINKCYPLSFPILGGRYSTRALQSSPFQNPGGGPLSKTDSERTDENPGV